MANLKLSRQVESLERLLIYVIGVAPWEFGLLPDQEGWLPLKEVIAAIRDQDGFRGVTEGRLMEIHRQPGGASPMEMDGPSIRLKPDRFEPPDPGEEPAAKPKVLHLALKPSSWPHVAQNGLRPKPGERGTRLFDDRAAAIRTTGRLYPEPVPVSVDVRRAEAGGARIAWYGPGLWHAAELRAEWLSGPPTPPEAEAPKPGRRPETEPPGAGAALWAEPAGPVAAKGKRPGKYDDAPAWKTSARRDRRKERD